MMATLQNMLEMNDGSFAKAEAMAKKFIAEGNLEEWLDLAMLCHAQGKLEETRKCHLEYAKHFPDCPRNKFSAAWLMLHDGDLQGGLEHIEAGRSIGTLGQTSFGNPTNLGVPQLTGVRWDGKADIKGKTVLLFCEAGIGDQMMNVRAVNWLSELGAKVVVSCSPSLMSLFSRMKNVAAVVSIESKEVYHDFYILALSSTRLCKRTWENLWSGSYLGAKPSEIWDRIIPKGFNIGLRWKGLPTFEHQQLRIFPPEKLFDAVQSTKAKFWSLQKEDRETQLPEYITNLEPLLGDWDQTATAITRMDLIITSDTAVGHLAGAMGKKTWIIVPAMPYWPWARPGPKTSWYPSVTLYRQRCYGNWDEPFEEIRQALQKEEFLK